MRRFDNLCLHRYFNLYYTYLQKWWHTSLVVLQKMKEINVAFTKRFCALKISDTLDKQLNQYVPLHLNFMSNEPEGFNNHIYEAFTLWIMRFYDDNEHCVLRSWVCFILLYFKKTFTTEKTLPTYWSCDCQIIICSPWKCCNWPFFTCSLLVITHVYIYM